MQTKKCHRIEGGFIMETQQYIKCAYECLNEDSRWEAGLKSWEGEVKSNVLPPDDPSDISQYFPEYEGKAFFRWLDGRKDTLRFVGTGQLKHSGVDVL